MAQSKATPFTRSEVITIVKRLVKPETYKASDIILFYKVYKLFPEEKFWRQYTGKYLVNSFAHYLTEEGKSQLKIDIAVFNLDIKPQESYTLSSTKIGEDYIPEFKPKTIAELFNYGKSGKK